MVTGSVTVEKPEDAVAEVSIPGLPSVLLVATDRTGDVPVPMGAVNGALDVVSLLGPTGDPSVLLTAVDTPVPMVGGSTPVLTGIEITSVPYVGIAP